MRRIFTVIIILCILYFFVGWIGVHAELLTKDSYFSLAGLFGSIASVAGLFALTRPAFTKNDFKNVEIDALKSVTEITEQWKQLELARAKTKEELHGLELQKQEMELLVKKASLVLFLKEQCMHYEKQITEEIARNTQLRSNLESHADYVQKLTVLNEEIDTHQNVRQLKEIIASAHRRHSSATDEFENEPPAMRYILKAARTLIYTIDSFFEEISRK